MEEKRDYFDNLHQELSEKFGITPDVVKLIRSFALGHNWSKDQMIQHLSNHISKKTVTQEGYMQAIKRAEYRIYMRKPYNPRKLEKIKLSLGNLNNNLTTTHTTLDIIFRLSPETWKALLVKTDQDK